MSDEPDDKQTPEKTPEKTPETDAQRRDSMLVRLGGESVYLGRFPFQGADPMSSVGQLERGHSWVMAALRALEERRVELAADQRFSDVGRLESLREQVRGPTAKVLGEVEELLARHREVLEKQRAELKPARDVERGDVVGEMRLSELRAVVRGWDRKTRNENIFRASPELKRAVALAPPELSGLSEQLHHALRSRMIEELHGAAALEQIQELDEAMQSVASAIDSARKAARRIVKLSDRDGAK